MIKLVDKSFLQWKKQVEKIKDKIRNNPLVGIGNLITGVDIHKTFKANFIRFS